MRQCITMAAVVAAFAVAVPSAMAAGTSSSSAKFCLKGPGTTENCKYETMAACDKDKKSGQQCVPNAGTTGAAPKAPAMKK